MALAAEGSKVENVGRGQALHRKTPAVEEYAWRLDASTTVTLGYVGRGQTQDSDELLTMATTLAPELQPEGELQVVEDPAATPDAQLEENATGDPALVYDTDATRYPKLPGQGDKDTNINGGGANLINDWSGTSTDPANKTVCATCTGIHRGNLVGVWQAILWADGFSSGLDASNCTVDGVFGAGTDDNTRTWQAYGGGQNEYYVASDGIVGPKSWGYAAWHLGRNENGTVIVYRGETNDLFFNRAYANARGNKNYAWDWNYSGWRYTGYTTPYIKKVTSGCSR